MGAFREQATGSLNTSSCRSLAVYKVYCFSFGTRVNSHVEKVVLLYSLISYKQIWVYSLKFFLFTDWFTLRQIKKGKSCVSIHIKWYCWLYITWYLMKDSFSTTMRYISFVFLKIPQGHYVFSTQETFEHWHLAFFANLSINVEDKRLSSVTL